METWSRLGRYIFSAGMIGLGALNLIHSSGAPGLEPVPAWIPGRPLWASLTGVIYLVAGAWVTIGRRPRPAAALLGALLLLLVILLHVPKLISNPRDGGAWTCAFEVLALGGAAWVLAGAFAAGRNGGAGEGRLNSSTRRRGEFGRYCFAVSLPVFGILHFIYHDYVAYVVPGWIPWHQFWAYFTGIAHVAAGVSLLSNVAARLAAALLGVMFGSWVLILHLPRVIANPGSREEWTSLFVALAMCGASWLVVGNLTNNPDRDGVDAR